jgi:hypothetical protein
MNRSGVCSRCTKLAVAVAIIAIAPAGVPANATAGDTRAPSTPVVLFPADLPTGPDDPRCLQNPGYAACQGGPYWVGPPAPPAPPGPPTGPLDPQCMSNPADAACVGSPFLPPAPPIAPPPPPPVEPIPPPPPPPVEPIAPPPIAPPPIAPPPVEPIAPPPMAPPPVAMPSDMGGMPGHI